MAIFQDWRKECLFVGKMAKNSYKAKIMQALLEPLGWPYSENSRDPAGEEA
jgi:hypothetical protein